MEQILKLDKFNATPFKQEIALEQVEHLAGFTTLRIRIREKSRFTIFEIDPTTAAHWGLAMVEWSKTQSKEGDK